MGVGGKWGACERHTGTNLKECPVAKILNNLNDKITIALHFDP